MLTDYTSTQLARKKRFEDCATWTGATVVLIVLLVGIVARLRESKPVDSKSVSAETGAIGTGSFEVDYE